MPDLHESLDHEAHRVRADVEALAAVRLRAVRNRRRRRIVAGVVSIMVGSAGVGLAYTAFTSMTPTWVASGTTMTDLPIWPDGTAGEIDRLQQAVDEGHQPGYLSPRTLAEIFATEVMNWEPDDIQVDAPVQAEGRDFAVARISNPTMAGEAGSPVLITVLEMRRWRGRPDGIFVVTRASSDVFSIQQPLPFEDFGPAPPVFEGEFGFVPDGVYSVGAWKSDISRVHAFGRATERYLIDDLPERLAWTSHPIATVRLFHWPEFPSKPTEGGRELTGPGLDGPVLAMSAYRLGEYTPDPQAAPSGSPSGTPVAGPTPSSGATTDVDAPILEVFNATGQDLGKMAGYVSLRVRSAEGIRSLRFVVLADAEEVRPTSLILCNARHRFRAAYIQQTMLPGAEIGSLPDGAQSDIQIYLGEDFANRELDGVQAYEFVRRFMAARKRGEGAEKFLAPAAAGLYRRSEGALALYGYYRTSHDITGISRRTDDPGDFMVVVRIPQTRDSNAYETLRVGRRDAADGDSDDLFILSAERNE